MPEVGCGTLSTRGHRHCDVWGCDCPCHHRWVENKRRRPHGYPRADWAHKRRRGDTERARLAAIEAARTW